MANPPAGLGPLAFIALIPLLWLLQISRPRRGFVLALVFGFAYYGATMYWLLLFGKLGWSGLALANAVYLGVFGLIAPAIWREAHPVRSAFAVAGLWTVVDYCRGTWPLGGLTWGGLGYTQVGNPLTLPLASVIGVWGITFAVVAVNALLLVAIQRQGRGVARTAGILGVAAFIVVAPMLIPIPAPNGRMVDVAAVQVAVPKGLALDPLLEDRVVADMHAQLYRTLAGGNPPDLGIWAENALDQDPTRNAELGTMVTDSIKAVGAPTLVGAIDGPDSGRQYNQSLLYNPAGEVTGVYTKSHLVPFGEYVPWRDRLSFLELLRQIPRDLTPGGPPHPLQYNGLRFGNVICFENAFPSIDRSLVGQGAEFLVTSTNNASYLHTAASEQHLNMDRMRAVENGRWVVHAAISGISAFVDPHGGVHQPTGLFEPVIDRRDIELSTRRTLYTRYGDWFVLLSFGLAAGSFLSPRRRIADRAVSDPLGPSLRTLVLLPTFNERATIETVVTAVLKLPERVDILVIDDSSPDGTGALVKAIAGREPRLRLVERPAKSGLASAYLKGFRTALDDGYDLVVEMDSDLSHRPEELSGLLAAASDFDLTIGSRYIPGGSVSNWSRSRVALSKAGNRYARLALGFDVADATSGYRVYHADLLRALLESGINSEGYGFQIELAYRAWLLGYRVGESPISFREREHGHSKISRRIVVEALWLVTIWGVRDRLRPPEQPFQVNRP